jgi:hypothetical protein
MVVVSSWLMATTAEGTINHWATNRQQFNRIFLPHPLPSENNFPLNSDYGFSYDGRLMEIPTEVMSNNPEPRGPARLSRPNFFSSGTYN